MVKAALETMGGDGGVSHFITKGDVVVIKPNVAFDKNPDLAATTQPDTLAAVVKLCLGGGARKVIVADNPINNPESCFFKTKVGEAAIRAGAELMLPKESYFEQLYVGGETITTHLEDVLPPLPRGDQGHRHRAGQGPQPLQGHGDVEELVRTAGQPPQPVPPEHPRHHLRLRA